MAVHIACYGWADPEGGSVATANHTLVRALAGLGHEITFLAKLGHVDPNQFADLENVTTHVVGAGDPSPLVMPLLRAHPLLLVIYNRARARQNLRLVQRSASRMQCEGASFDVMLVLGVSDVPALAVPVIVWPQAPPGVEATAFLSLWREVVRPGAGSRAWLLWCYQRLRMVGLRASHPPRRASRTITQSAWGAQRFIDAGYRASDVAVVPYPFYGPSGVVSMPTNRTPTAVRLLHMGRLDPRKRVDLLLAAFHLVRKQQPEAELVILGRPGYLTTSQALEQIRNTPGVVYLPHVPRREVWRHLAQSDLLVQTSLGETLGTSVVDAQLAGLTVVVGMDNGSKEYIDGAYSSMFDAYTPSAVAAAIMSALNARRRDPQGARLAAQRAAAVFDPTSVATQVVSVLEEALRDRQAYC